jgi:hypothetical protein
MQCRYVVLIATLLAGTSASAAPDMPTYAVTDLKALGIWPVAMNNRGEVLGNNQLEIVALPPVRSFLYSAGIVRELFPPTDSPNFTWPRILSDGGHAVLASNTGRIWLYDGTTYRELSPPPPESADDSLGGWSVHSVNTSGQVAGSVVWYKQPPQQFETAVAWAWVDDHGTLRNLSPDGEQGCQPASEDAINAHGDVALQCDHAVGVMYRDGTWRRIDDRYVVVSAFNDAASVLVSGQSFDTPTYVFSDGEMRLIEPACPEGSLSCQAFGRDLNNRGEAVGGTYYLATIGSTTRSLDRALVWRDGETIDVHPAGAFSSVLASVNESGVAIGTYFAQDGGRPRPFVYASDTTVDISELRGVGAALDAALAKSNEVGVRIANSGHILVVAYELSYANPPHVVFRHGAYLLSPVAPTVSLSADATRVRVGRPVTLTWNSTDANSCEGSGGVSGDGWARTWPTSGQVTVTSSTATSVNYALRCSAGNMYRNATVAVAYTRKSGGGGRLDALAALLLSFAGLGLSRRRKAV